MNGLWDTMHRNIKSVSVSPAPPDGIDAGVVVPRTGCFEIPVGIGAAKCELHGQHRSDGFCVCGQDHLLASDIEMILQDGKLRTSINSGRGF